MGPEDVKRLREKAGHTQEEAAAIVGVTVGSWSRWERGEHKFKASHLRYYALKTGQKYPDDVRKAP